MFRQLLVRQPASHKYDYGHVLVIGGSPGMVGAPFLSAKAALRIGAGLVTMASTPEVIDKLEKRVTEIMTLRLSSHARELTQFISERKVSVIVVGPGMKAGFANAALAAIGDIDLPLIVDGGGLAALSEHHLRAQHLIVTPHLGEFERLYMGSVPPDLSEAAKNFAKEKRLILVLKGHPSYISDSGQAVYQDSSGGPELATAGTGDVLSGVIAGVIAQKIKPLPAVKAAVRLHGLAGKIAAELKTVPGVIASDVIEAIPAALKLVQEEEL